MLVMIVEDHPMVRRAVADELRRIRPELTVLERGDLRTTLEALAAGTIPDLIVLDLMLPDAKGMGAIQEISAIFPVDRIVAFSGEEDRELLICVHERGVRGFILKSSPATSEQFRAVLAGQRSFPPLPKRDQEMPLSLTALELEVLKFMASPETPGSFKHVARNLKLTERATLRTIQRIRKKLGASTKAQAIARARQLGLIRN
jgi:DNA-binding NarL/FixJ family response regulator